jgi:hypothetical protein
MKKYLLPLAGLLMTSSLVNAMDSEVPSLLISSRPPAPLSLARFHGAAAVPALGLLEADAEEGSEAGKEVTLARLTRAFSFERLAEENRSVDEAEDYVSDRKAALDAVKATWTPVKYPAAATEEMKEKIDALNAFVQEQYNISGDEFDSEKYEALRLKKNTNWALVERNHNKLFGDESEFNQEHYIGNPLLLSATLNLGEAEATALATMFKSVYEAKAAAATAEIKVLRDQLAEAEASVDALRAQLKEATSAPSPAPEAAAALLAPAPALLAAAPLAAAPQIQRRAAAPRMAMAISDDK